MAIASFRCAETEALFHGRRVARRVNIERAALRKLEQLAWSAVPDDLRVSPGNRLELLKGNRRERHGIRINDPWRVCFVWTPEGAAAVEIADYR